MISYSDGMNLDIYKRNRQRIKRDLNYIKQGIHLYCLDNNPTIQCRLFGYETITQGMVFFETIEELLEYADKDGFPNTAIVDFIGNFEGQTDVIRIASLKNVFYVTSFDECHIRIYDKETSKQENESVWQDYVGYLKDEYEAFQKMGITLQNDIYGSPVDDSKKEKMYVKAK